MNKVKRGYSIFTIGNNVFLILVALLCIIPLIHILAVSFSGRAAANANIVGLWPVDFNVDAYVKTIGNEQFVNAIWTTIKRTVLGTAIGMAITILTAYPLSKESNVFKGRTVFAWALVFTMLFSGGLVPTYILVQKLHLFNTIWALILPGIVGVYNIILMLNFFRIIPKELEEASLIDGANHITILLRVYLPISLPSLATLILFTMVGHWNSWFDGLIYMTKPENYPLATYLQTVIVQQDFSKISVKAEDLANISQRTVKSAQIFIGMLPILLIYPFFQRFFVKGIVVGAVKE
ncbi:carbohydrate ABC transporter permease [Paenibacillus sp. FSL K6-3182]|uniref:carbohydrate ABC transporter permease n=1 Tax=Paenibacillus sp. FSL K6-3182 TaxID=2921495 RepID=UPI0030CEB421